MPRSDTPSDVLRLLDRLDRIAATRGISVRIGTRNTRGKKWREGRGKEKRGRGWRTESRSAGLNAIILRTQAKRGRDAIDMSTSQRERVRGLWEEGVRAIVQGASSGEPLEKSARRIGDLILDAIRGHLDAGAGAKGPFKAIKPGTERAKERETKEKGLPVLTRTRQLARSLVVTIRKL